MKLLAQFVTLFLVNGFILPQSPTFTNRLSLSSTALSSTAETAVVFSPATSSITVTLTAPGPEVKTAFDRGINEVGKALSAEGAGLKGFRPNSKIPPAVLLPKIMGSPQLKSTLHKSVISTLLKSTIDREVAKMPLAQYEIIGSPRLKSDEEVVTNFLDPSGNSPLLLEIECDVWPTVTFPSGDAAYKNLKASYQRPPFDESAYEQSLSDLADRYASLKIKEGDDPILEEGDATVVIMDGFFMNDDGTKGEPLPEGKASGDQVDIVMKPGRYMVGLVEGLIGAKSNEQRDVKVTFPPQLKDKELAGKPVIFEVTPLSVDSRIIPPLDDAFAQMVRPNVPDYTFDQLQTELKKAVDEEGKDAETILKARDAALEEALLSNVDIVIPESLITTRVREKFALMLTEMRDNGSSDDVIKHLVTPENFEKYREIAKDDVTAELRSSIVVEEIGRLEKITVAEQEVNQLLERVRQQQEQQNDTNTEFDEAGVKSQIEATLMRRYVFDLIAQEAAELNVSIATSAPFSDSKEFDQKMMDELLESSVEREEGKK